MGWDFRIIWAGMDSYILTTPETILILLGGLGVSILLSNLLIAFVSQKGD